MKNICRVLAPLYVFTLLFSGSAFAEPRVYVRSNGQFVNQGNEYPRGFWLPAVRGADDVFRQNPEAYQEYLDHVADARWFSILNWGALGAFIAYTAISSGADNYNGGLGLAIFVVPWIGGIVMAAKSNKHLLRAINLVNGVPPAQASNSFRV